MTKSATRATRLRGEESNASPSSRSVYVMVDSQSILYDIENVWRSGLVIRLRNLDQHSGLREAPEGTSSRGSTASLQGAASQG